MLSIWRDWRRKCQANKLKDPDYKFLFSEPQDDNVYVCFDCETTGLNPKKDKIVSLSAIKIKGNQVLTSGALNLLIQQEGLISPESIAVHRIRNVDLQDGEIEVLTEREAIGRFLHFIQGYPLVGYYLEFDVAMVNGAISDWLGVRLPNRMIEVSELYYQQRLKEVSQSIAQPNIDLKFDSILKRLDVPNLGQHDAFSDALMTSLIFLKLQQPR
ncbi:3'-5' exonuclease [Thiomicrorhabdus sp. ZW0627]|uniref:3'-5' exonuclease n=1 Tax=Thiomicrorhabdus sp. ZW0627 TaxID=3039774 RepID=UPI002436FC1E|nr:3'-5' exonuclease [Thiomicrorhabdus sp. ZW0627]MDG6773091.1 3'-5' exonuclease [Thiomicrorhabdus sp. ZW0627]